MKMWRYGDLNKTSRYHDDDVTLQLTNDFAALRRIFPHEVSQIREIATPPPPLVNETSDHFSTVH